MYERRRVFAGVQVQVFAHASHITMRCNLFALKIDEKKDIFHLAMQRAFGKCCIVDFSKFVKFVLFSAFTEVVLL